MAWTMSLHLIKQYQKFAFHLRLGLTLHDIFQRSRDTEHMLNKMNRKLKIFLYWGLWT